MKVVISETALESLLIYGEPGPDRAATVRQTLESLAADGQDKQVLRLTGLHHPVWTCALDPDTTLYFLYGRGAAGPEIRIAHVGPPPHHPSFDPRHVVHASGDLAYQEIPDRIATEEHLTAAPPELPERTIGPDAPLRSYLAPSEETLLDALADADGTPDDLHGRRYRILAGLRPAQDLPLRLSPQQERLLAMPLPLLFQGVAGSGKTTVVARFAHRQLLRSTRPGSVLVVAYTEDLKRFTRTILAGLDELEPTQSSSVEVLTWHELCNGLARQAGLPAFSWAPDDFFLEQLRLAVAGLPTVKDPHLAYQIREFIRSTVKGEWTDPHDPPPGARGRFLRMNAIPLDRRLDRAALFDLVTSYQLALATRGWSDDTDAARILLGHLDRLPRYDYVLVDEVQDYTFVQLLLLVRLCRGARGLLFAGDVDQILHPSRFTWERVRAAMWTGRCAQPPQPVTIDYNYRSPQPVTELANALLRRRARALDLPAHEPALTDQALTPRPIRLVLPPAELRQLVAQLAGKIGSLGVITKRESGELLVGGIRFERAFTPRQVKGLEFNVVCLVDFNEHYRELAGRPKDYSPERLRLEFNEVYVAATRTRAQLLLLDHRALRHGLWECPEVAPLIDEAENAAALIRLVTAHFENRSRADWEADAIEFESQNAYAAAGECWERCARLPEAARAYAKGGRLEKALNIYLAIEELGAAAGIAVRLGRYAEAADLFRRDGQLGKAAATLARVGRHFEAGTLVERAAEEGRPGGDWAAAAHHYRAAKAHAAAARCFERAGDTAAAAVSWLASGDPARAGVLFEQDGNWLRAVEAWTAAGDELRLAAAQDRIGRRTEAARTRAAHHRSEGRFHEAAVEWRAAGDLAAAAAAFEGADEWAAAGDVWRAAGEHRRAATAFERAGDWVRAGECWAAAGEDLRLADMQERQGRAVEAAATRAMFFERHGRFAEAGQLWTTAGEPRRAAAAYERAGDPEAAAASRTKASGQHPAATSRAGVGGREDAVAGGLREAAVAGEPARPVPVDGRARDPEAAEQPRRARSVYARARRKLRARWMIIKSWRGQRGRS